MKSGMPKFILSTSEVWGNNNLLVAEVEWMFSDKNGKEVDSGKSLVV